MHCVSEQILCWQTSLVPGVVVFFVVVFLNHYFYLAS